MKTTVRHSRGAYEVELTDLASVLGQLGGQDFVVTDENVRDAIRLASDHLAVQPGEGSKDVQTLGRVWEWLAGRADRSGRLVALGGGVVGDLAGFAAATYMRGIDLVMVPTSLLAMVDSSVGGKVGIDLPQGKNLAGAFWPPVRVLIPIDALRTLPARHFANGSAEVWKNGAALDERLFESLLAQPLQADAKNIAEIVFQCIELKKAVVEEDEFETTGRRAVLNFGHTVGHAIEQAMNYEGILHGEAVAIGMVVESRLAENIGVASPGVADTIQKGLQSQGLPTRIPGGLAAASLIEAMRRDKKARRNGLAFAFVSQIGTSKLIEGVPENDVLKVLENQ
jgi:3-dehydroquinate synthase